MKKFKMLLLMFVLAAGPMTFVSCEEDEPEEQVTSDACMDELVALADILQQKSNAFSANATVSTCGAVRTAALNLINRAEQCGYGYLYEEQAQFWIDYDCSVFE